MFFNKENSVLVVVDMQEKLMPAIAGQRKTVSSARKVIRAARLLSVPVIFTEQNPGGLGPTIPELAPEPGENVLSKRFFDATRDTDLLSQCRSRNILVVGGEAHVCVLQTCMGLLRAGQNVSLLTDAIGSRDPANKLTAIERLKTFGAGIATTEMAIFEWLETCDAVAFREILSLVKDA